MNTKLIRRALTAAITSAVLLTGGLAAAAPAQAATIHNRMIVKIAGKSVTLDEWNLTSKSKSYNIDCHKATVWAKYRYVAYKPGTTTRYFTHDVYPLRSYYINDYFWAKTRSYKSAAAFTADFNRLLNASSETVKTKIGYYCLRDTRRDETKVVLQQWVGNINYYSKRLSGDADLSAEKWIMDAAKEITTPHAIVKVFSVKGTPAGGYTASLMNKTDGYVWYYESSTGKYSELKY